MKKATVSIRYAQALFDLAVENNNVEAVSSDMGYLVQVNEENRDFQLLLSSPVIKSEKKVAILKEIFVDFQAVSAGFVALIAKNGREAILPQIADAYLELVKKKNNITSITIVTATKLDEGVKKQILDKVKVAVKGELEVTEEIDPSLIGGFVVRMGDIRIDASVASKLGQLKQRLTK